MQYDTFLESKRQLGGNHGFDPEYMPDFLFDFQSALVEWGIQKGRAAIFADCGLGKTPMQLVWAQNIVDRSSGRVLIVTPLAVSYQTIREAEKFGINSTRSDDGKAYDGITVTNYERLHLFDSSDFEGTVCDESSAIKNFQGKRRKIVTQFMQKQKYRLLATATAAPNDYIELGTSSEALGYLGYVDMLGKFFKNNMNNIGQGRQWSSGGKWRFKGHAEDEFWRWVSSWARAMRRPSDLGFDDSKFELPPLTEHEHIVKSRTVREGELFDSPAQGLHEQREEQRRTLTERCEMAAEIVNNTTEPAVMWCHLNDEGKMLKKLVPDAVEISGSDSDEKKERAFMGFQDGKIRVLITKPKIGAWGLNWQHCAHMTFFPSHSYEAYYQAIRRSWRFGQTRPVSIDIITTEGGRDVMANLQRKRKQADKMFENLMIHMNDALSIKPTNGHIDNIEIPGWLK